MFIAPSLRFRLLLDLVKNIIFAIDSLPVQVPVPHRAGGNRAIHVPEVGDAVMIRSGNHHLAGWFAGPPEAPRAAVLVFHGIGDRMRYWRRAQKWLADAGIASLVFTYSGYPGSGGQTTPESLERDAHAAYAWLRRELAIEMPVFLLGFSLGTGLAAEVAGTLDPPPAGLILAQGFTSLRDAARRIGRPATGLARLLPDIWISQQSVARLRFPLLILHTSNDTLFPVSMAETLAAAARAGGAPVEFTVLDGYAHNAAYLLVPEDYWQVVLEFILRNSGSVQPTHSSHKTTAR